MKKKLIRLTEGDLRRIVNNSVKRALRENSRRKKRMVSEAGHIYHKDEDGNVYTNSKETYRGVPGSTYIWHGEWSDPEILWKGSELNANDVEDTLWEDYQDACRELKEKPTEDGFEDWLDEMGTNYIASTLDEIDWSTNGNDE